MLILKEGGLLFAGLYIYSGVFCLLFFAFEGTPHVSII